MAAFDWLQHVRSLTGGVRSTVSVDRSTINVDRARWAGSWAGYGSCWPGHGQALGLATWPGWARIELGPRGWFIVDAELVHRGPQTGPWWTWFTRGSLCVVHGVLSACRSGQGSGRC